jgi:hypothetical protein
VVVMVANTASTDCSTSSVICTALIERAHTPRTWLMQM